VYLTSSIADNFYFFMNNRQRGPASPLTATNGVSVVLDSMGAPHAPPKFVEQSRCLNCSHDRTGGRQRA
jgi:hypothetical protein